MNTANLLAAAEHLVGFLIVILALAVLWGLTALMGRVIGQAGAKKPAASASGSAPQPEGADETEDELIVIAAATAAMIGHGHRVVSVRPVPSTWGQQGRRDIHASHRIR